MMNLFERILRSPSRVCWRTLSIRIHGLKLACPFTLLAVCTLTGNAAAADKWTITFSTSYREDASETSDNYTVVANESSTVAGSYSINHLGGILEGAASGGGSSFYRVDSMPVCAINEVPMKAPAFSQQEGSYTLTSFDQTLAGVAERFEPDGRNTIRFGVGPFYCSSNSTLTIQNVNADCSLYGDTQESSSEGICSRFVSGTLKAVDASNTHFVFSDSLSETAPYGMNGTRTSTTTWSFEAIKTPVPSLHGIELTQAIQKYQKLSTMRSYLSTHDSNPPVPLVAYKPLADCQSRYTGILER